MAGPSIRNQQVKSPETAKQMERLAGTKRVPSRVILPPSQKAESDLGQHSSG